MKAEENLDNNDSIKHAIKGYIMDEFLAGEDPNALTDATPLITGGILDSIATIKLVAFLENNFKIEVEAHEMGVDALDNLSRIAELIQSKLGASL
jgi:acyl carrier protein